MKSSQELCPIGNYHKNWGYQLLIMIIEQALSVTDNRMLSLHLQN